MLSCSTSWNYRRHKTAEPMVREILDLGFDAIELGHGLKLPMVADLFNLHRKMKFKVSTLHNFCPMPVEVMGDDPDCYEFTSHRDSDRQRAVRLTLETIDMAQRFETDLVVVHTGRIRTLTSTVKLRGLVEKGALRSAEYHEAKIDAIHKRDNIREIYLQRALECLIQITDYASKKGIRIGIENREHFEAVPAEGEIDNFLRRLDAPNAGYWHDFGHAQIKHNLGLIDHQEWLEFIGHRAIGGHVHDVKWPFQDHRAPFTGDIDYTKLTPNFPKGCRFVFELHPRTEQEDILAAIPRWRELTES